MAPRRVLRKKAKQSQPTGDDTAPNSVCEYCEKTFLTRGLKHYQNRCTSKDAWTEAHQPRSYRFCALNEHVFENILSFSGQSDAKLQMIDHWRPLSEL
ncbi:hypothetical protein F444_19564 [Phytophthora nicotianae P1976]|uniref:Uncharacterized protein n=1 Tax=Phytophthora nicotianae P1976 TaxID=1317066 RepID=A0A080Z7C6_PHYNI|nr:hypothetical protein F444_19564 [Phytophthora nicotianae P1976]